MNEINEFKKEVVVISAEDFCRMNEEEVGTVKKLLSGFEVNIILYLRNYKKYAKSHYAEIFRSKPETRSFREFLEQRPDILDYSEIIRKWNDQFGADHIIVKVYDEIIKKNELLKDFSGTIGYLPNENDKHLTMKVHTSLSEKTVNSIRFMNLLYEKFPFIMSENKRDRLIWSYGHQKNDFRIIKYFFGLFAKKHYFGIEEQKMVEELSRKFDKALILNFIGPEGLALLEA